MARTSGAYVTRGRGIELEREIAQAEARMQRRLAELEGIVKEQRAELGELVRLLTELVREKKAA